MMKSKLRSVLLVSAMLVPSVAWAQSNAEPDSSTSLEADAGSEGEIVVTARRTNENLQDVPIAIFAADAEALAKARIDSAENLAQISPSIRFTTTNNAASGVNILIRGVGTTGNQRAFEGAVGFFVDGVYRSRSGQALSDFLDVESLQILRGPQSTLFGKNTSAGALLLTSNKPKFDAFGGTYQVTLGNYDARTVKAALNIPLSDTVAFRVAGSYRDRDGFISDPNSGLDYDNIRARSVKAQLLFQPSDSFSAHLIGDYTELGGNCCSATVFYQTTNATGVNRNTLVENIIRSKGLTPPSRNLSDYEAVLTSRPPRKIQDRGISLQMKLDTGVGELSSITAYRKFRTNNPDQDLDFTGADITRIRDDFSTEFFSQELTLAGEFGADSRSKYLVGLFFSDENTSLYRASSNGVDAQTYFSSPLSGYSTRGIVAPAGLFSISGASGHNKSFSGFAQVDYAISDLVTVTAGARYSRERKTGSYFSIFDDGNTLNWPNRLGVYGLPYSDKSSDNALTGTAGIQFRPNDDTMLYVSYSRGFKSGGVTLDSGAVRVVGDRAVYKPEFVNTYEAGAKLDLFDRRVRANVAVFYNDITDLQVAQFLGLTFSVLNSPTAKIAGAEFEGTWQISDALKFNAAATWLPTAKYDPNDTRLGVLQGRRAGQAPKLTLNAGMSFDTPLNDNLAFAARVVTNYTSESYISTSSLDTQKATTLVNASVGISSLNGGWTLEGFVDNLFDKRYPYLTFSRPIQSGVTNAYVGAPRTFGVTLRGSF